MKRWFQKFGFRESCYHRPNQDWVCGRGDGKNPCAMGPTPGGECHATFECHPHKEGDRWVCNRPRKGADEGPCECGPSPDGVCGRPMTRCSPRRSMRALRARVVFVTFACSLGATALLLTSERGRVFMTPGELSSVHAFHDGSCADCHEHGDEPPFEWLSKAAASPHSTSNEKCLSCHDLGPDGANPHSLSATQLEQWTSEAATAGSEGLARPPFRVAMSAAFARPTKHESGVSCSACHQEHRGRNHDLTAIANHQCQVCHQNQFTHFATGHPPFGDYPFRKRNRIVFDHKTHVQLHFKTDKHKDAAPTSCLECHQVDATGEPMLIKPFERACAACHDKDFAGFDTGTAGIPALRIPLLDVEGFEDAGISVGEWPDDWDSLETTLSPFTQFLLADNQRARAALAQLDGKDLDVINEDDQSAGAELAWGLKELLHGVGENGLPELERRIQSALGRELTRSESYKLKRVISPAMLKATSQKWFPNLEKEIQLRRSGMPPETAFMDLDDMEERLSLDPAELGRNWIRTDANLTLAYRPTSHADPFMKLWLSLARAAQVGPADAPARKLFQSLGGDSEKVAAGRCMKCHTSDERSPTQLHWTGKRPDLTSRTATRFSHASHFHLLQEKNCVTCHRFDFSTTSRDYLAAFDYHNSGESGVATGNFRNINKSTCAQCHTSDSAGENCLSCHNYHVGSFGRIPPNSALIQALPGAVAR